MGFNNDDMAARLQQQTMQMQQVSITSYCSRNAENQLLIFPFTARKTN
jgi:hypothetical protein